MRTLLLLTGLALTAGCSSSAPPAPPVAEVSGKVILNGKPVVQAQVWFRPEKGPTAFGRTDAEGKFDLALASGQAVGAVIGKHRVTVVTGIAAPATSTDTNTQLPDVPPKSVYEYAFKEPTEVPTAGTTVELDLSKATKRPG
jgi:hypothetical protein